MSQVQISDLKKISEYEWEIPKTYREDMRVPVRLFVSRALLEQATRDKSLDQAVNAATERVYEESETEHAVHDRRYTGQVVDCDADKPCKQTLARIFLQVNGRNDAQRGDEYAHQQYHQHRAIDGREYAALGVGLARVVLDELPQLVEKVPEFAGQAHTVRAVGIDDRIHRQLEFMAVRGGYYYRIASQLSI